MHTHSIDDFRHSHVFLGKAHERNERKTWAVIAVCTTMMVAEIIGGMWLGSVALIADGLHMSTHACALLIAALAYTSSRHYANDARLTFGTGKFGDLAAFDPPPLKWSDLNYVFWHQGGPICRGRDTRLKRSSRSCGRSTSWFRRARRSRTPSARSG